MRSSLWLLTFGLLGCVSLPHAKLVVVGQGTREVVTGPVVCGPLGFRKVPLQSRWGEYVRVTVAAPSMITGTVLVHANGVAWEPRSWSTESGALVIDAQFPNEDPDARFALDRERPIDITLTGLTALNGGTCEGAVFTVEQGVLIPSVDERAWIAELERRGGPELAARRERARVEAEARRQAHYAAWEARQQVEVSAQVVAQAEVIRQAHYAQWELARSTVSVAARDNASLSAGAAVSLSTGGSDSLSTGGSDSLSTGGSVSLSTGGSVSLSPGERVGVRGSDLGAVDATTSEVVQNGSAGVSGTSESVGVMPSGPAASAVLPTCSATGGAAVSSGVLVSGSRGVSSSTAAPTCAARSTVLVSSGVGGSVAAIDVFANTHAVVPGSAGFEASMPGTQVVVPGSVGFEASVAGSASAEFAAFPTASPQPIATVGAGEWSQPSDSLLRTPSRPAVAQPSDVNLQAGVQVQSGWAQPYEPRLDAVPVSTESQVATGAQVSEPRLEAVAVSTESQVVTGPQYGAVSPPPPAPCGRCRPAAPVVSVGVDGAALLNLMLHVGAAAAQVPAPVHGAQPVSR